MKLHMILMEMYIKAKKSTLNGLLIKIIFILIILIKKLWEKAEFTEDYGLKEYQTNYYKIEITFINRFSDFSYDASKGGYFASTSKTSEVTVDGETNGGFEVTDVLVKFNKTEITEINFNYDDGNTDGNTVVNYSVTSIGSTKFTFPTIYQ